MRRSVMLLLILALVGSTVAPFLSVKANPHGIIWPEDVPAPASVNLTVGMESPTENALYSNGTINVCFNVTISGPDSISMSLFMTTYQGDWMQKSLWCPFQTGNSYWQTYHFLQYNFSVTGIPFGKHSLNFTAHAQGDFTENYTAYHFMLEKTVSVKFAVHTNPVITFPLFQNASSTNSAFPLNFTVNHQVSEIAYCLDGQESVPISGNMTLTGLSNGQHNVTVYATDEFGNTGASDTLFFNVNAQEFPVVPFPTEIVATASGASVAAVGVGLLVYLRKRKH